MRTLRVAALMDSSIVSGPGRQLVAVAGALREFGVETRLITFHRRGRPVSPFPAYARERGLACDVIEEAGRFDPGVVRRVRRALERLDPHVIQSHSYKPAAVAALCRLQLATPWIGMFHGTTQEDRRVRLYNWLDRRLLRLATRVVVVSPSQVSLFGSIKDRVQVIPNAVLDPDTTSDAGAAGFLRTLPRPRLGVIGRLSFEKGVDVFLEAFAQLTRSGFPGSGVVIGDGPEREALERKAASSGLQDRIAFAGLRPDVHALYRELDLVVIPSRSEGMPNVLLECVRADRPVVATAVGAIPDVVGNTGGALLVTPEDPVALADGIRRGLVELQLEPARQGRASIAETYSLPRRARLFRELYDAVTRAQRDPAAPRVAASA